MRCFFDRLKLRSFARDLGLNDEIFSQRCKMNSRHNLSEGMGTSLVACSLRAVHVVATTSTEAAGPSYTVPRLCMSLAQMNVQTDLLAVGPDVDVFDQGFRYARFSPDFADVPVARALRGSRRLRRELARLSTTADVVHDHGLWLMPNVHAGWAADKARKPLVLAPRGMLGAAALQFSRIKKAIFWRALQGRVARRAACLHATSEHEYLDIRAIGLRNPVAIVSNGVDLPKIAARQERSGDPRTVLYLGRLHPKKGLDLLIRSWGKLECAFPDWRLRIVGPSEQGYVDTLRALASATGLRRVTFDGPLFGLDKIEAYRSADIYVLPTLNENFAMTVAEALAAELPVIATKGSPWGGLTAERCGWWINHGVQPLSDALSDAMSRPVHELRAMGVRGRLWMERDFNWEPIGMQMRAVYEWLTRGAQAPRFVEFT
jgi:glycosyltransferase involved in cell wall biosynthesis